MFFMAGGYFCAECSVLRTEVFFLTHSPLSSPQSPVPAAIEEPLAPSWILRFAQNDKIGTITANRGLPVLTVYSPEPSVLSPQSSVLNSPLSKPPIYQSPDAPPPPKPPPPPLKPPPPKPPPPSLKPPGYHPPGAPGPMNPPPP